MEPKPWPGQPLGALICPVCAGSFSFSAEGTAGVACESGHRFDRSRHGYLNLITGSSSKFTPDSASMVRARASFLASGHFEPLVEGLNRAFADFAPQPGANPLIVDAGCGTGHYLAGMLRGAASGYPAIGLDLSPEALRHAVRANPGMLALVWDLWRPLPLAANSADALFVVFAPRNIDEFHRVLRPDGLLVIATPLPEHLSGLPALDGRLGQQPEKQAALAAAVEGRFTSLAETEIRVAATLHNAEAKDLLLMGPTGHHLDPEALRAMDQAEYRVDFGFRISAFRPLPTPADPPVLRLPGR